MTNTPFTEHALVFTGPGSQPAEEDGAALEYMEMPQGMRTFSAPDLPEPEDMAGHAAALAVFDEVLAALNAWRTGDANPRFDVLGLSPVDRDLVAQVLGEGEVSVIAGATVQAQESVLAGVWRVRMLGADGSLLKDMIEVGAFPEPALAMAREHTAPEIADPIADLPDGVVNAPALLTELSEEIEARTKTPKSEPHVINLTLLPHTEDDLTFLTEKLGRGAVTIISRGYGNCRIQSTETHNVWWVQYFNSQDALILNTLEVTPIPIVACAAQEDIDDSAERLREILDVYR